MLFLLRCFSLYKQPAGQKRNVYLSLSNIQYRLVVIFVIRAKENEDYDKNEFFFLQKLKSTTYIEMYKLTIIFLDSLF